MSVWRHKKFDPTAEYVVSKPLLFGSHHFKRGELFDAKTTERQKRILYDARFLRLAPENVHQESAANGHLILNEQEVEELNALMDAHEDIHDPLGIAPDNVITTDAIDSVNSDLGKDQSPEGALNVHSSSVIDVSSGASGAVLQDGDTKLDQAKDSEAEQKLAKPARHLALAGRGWYNVEEGEKGCGNFINTKTLRLKEAEKLLTQ